MTETMEQYMSKIRGDYGSGIARPKIDDKDHFELKGQFLKELQDNAFSGSDHEDANERIKIVLEIVDLFHEVILFYNGLDVLTRQILDSKGVIPTKTAVDAKVAIQEMAEYSQKWHNGTTRTRSTKTFDGLATIQAQFNNLGREIKKVNDKVYAAQVRREQCKGPYYTKDFPLKEEGLRERVELDLEATLMGETLVLNRSLDPLYGDYIELNDLNVPLELRRDQVDDFMPTIEEGEWKIWMATEIKTWEISSLENHSEKLRKKVSLHDKLNGLSHPYQKLKSFYKGVLNLGSEYVRDAMMEEWLTRGNISVHEME
ncbi:hypothetical protein Tco_1344665 [Tanacetum coccineum]